MKHEDENGEINSYKGDDPWPLNHLQEVLVHARPLWIVETEGEKCCGWVMAAGYVCVSQPGHDRSREAVARRYSELKATKVAGINDPQGDKYAQTLAEAASDVWLQFRWIRATDFWCYMPIGGSIDDATGTAKDRFAAVFSSVVEDETGAAFRH